jgi:hypothetical protein
MKVRRDSWLIYSLYLRRFRPALTSYIRVEGADQWDAQGAGPAARRLHDGLHATTACGSLMQVSKRVRSEKEVNFATTSKQFTLRWQFSSPNA